MTDMDEEMKMALMMSMQENAPAKEEKKPEEKKPEEKPNTDLLKVMEDPNFVNSVLLDLPGVDPDDPKIKDVLNSLNKKDDEKK